MKRHWGIYLLSFGHLAYYQNLRQNVTFIRPENAQDTGEYPEPRLKMVWRRFDLGFREFLKFQMYDNLFSNTWIDNRTGQALWDLTQVPKY